MSKAARKYDRTKSLLIAVLFFLLSGAETFACSRMPRTLEQMFDSYIAVFSGVAISAEVISLVPGTELEKEAAKTGIVPIKVRWKIDEIFKGKDLEGKSAFTTNYYCGGVPIIVGQPYVFAIGPIERDSEIFRSSMNSSDIIGYLDDIGTMGIFSFENAPEKYNTLVASFKKLSKHR